jgi:hypothetical protein
MNKEMPLSVMLENVKGRMTSSFGQIMQESNLPAYLIEGILVGILADVRNQKNLELASDYNSMNHEEKKEEETEGKGEE